MLSDAETAVGYFGILFTALLYFMSVRITQCFSLFQDGFNTTEIKHPQCVTGTEKDLYRK